MVAQRPMTFEEFQLAQYGQQAAPQSPTAQAPPPTAENTQPVSTFTPNAPEPSTQYTIPAEQAYPAPAPAQQPLAAPVPPMTAQYSEKVLYPISQGGDPLRNMAIGAETQRLAAATPPGTLVPPTTALSSQAQANIDQRLAANEMPWQEKRIPREVRDAYPAQAAGAVKDALGQAKDAIGTVGPISALGGLATDAASGIIQAASIPAQRLQEVQITRKYDELTTGQADATFGDYLPSTLLGSSVVDPVRSAAQAGPGQYEALNNWLNRPENADLIVELFETGYGGESGYAAVNKYYTEQQGLGGITADILGDPFVYGELGAGAARGVAGNLAKRAGTVGRLGRAAQTGLDVADAMVFDPLRAPGLVVRGLDAALPAARVGQRLESVGGALRNATLTEAGRAQRTLNTAEQEAAILNEANAGSQVSEPWLFERDAQGRIQLQTTAGGITRPLVRDPDTGAVRPVQQGDLTRAFEIARRLPHERSLRTAGTPTTLERHMGDWMALVNNPRAYSLPREVDTLFPRHGAAYRVYTDYAAQRIRRFGQEAVDGMYGDAMRTFNEAMAARAPLKAIPKARRTPAQTAALKRAEQGVVNAAYMADRLEAALEIAGRSDASAKLRKADLSRIRRTARSIGGYGKNTTYSARLAAGAVAPPGGTPARLSWQDVADVVDDDTRRFAEQTMTGGGRVGDMVLGVRQDLARLSDLAKQTGGGPLSPWDQQEFERLLTQYRHLLPDADNALRDLAATTKQVAAWNDRTIGTLTAQEARRQIGIDRGLLDKAGNVIPTGAASRDDLVGRAVRALDAVGSKYRKFQLYNPLNILRYSGLQAAGNAVTLAIGDAGALLDYGKAIAARTRSRGRDEAITPADQMMREAGIGSSPFIKQGIKDDLAREVDQAGPVESVLRAGRRFAGAFDISLREAAYMHRFQPRYRALQRQMRAEAARRAATMGVPISTAQLDTAFAALDALHPRYKAWSASELKEALLRAARPDVQGTFIPRTGATPTSPAPGTRATVPADVEQRLRQRLDGLGLTDIGLEVVDNLSRYGDKAMGIYEPWRKVITIARDSQTALSASDPFTAMRSTLDHEAIHAMRDLGLFREGEFELLVREARTIQKPEARGSFVDVAERENIGQPAGTFSKRERAIADEEAVAELFAYYRLGQKGLSQPAQGIISRIFEFMNGLIHAIRGSELADTLDMIDRGEIGGRARGPSQSATNVRHFRGADVSLSVENWADRVARDYANGVRKLHQDAIANVNRLGFSFEETKADALLGKVFMYHYWSSRANMLYTREMLGNPALLNAYVSLWKTLDREGQKADAPPWLRGFYAFMQSPMGLTVFANPTALLNTFAIFNPDILGEGYQGNLTDLGKARQRSPFMINPVIDQLLFAAGLYGSGAQTPNIMPISGAKLYDWLTHWNATTDTPLWKDANGNPVPPPMALRTLGGRAVAQLIAEKVSPAAKEVADRLGIPADVMQFGDMAASQHQDLTFLMLDILAEDNPGLDQNALLDLLVDEHGGGFDTGDPVYQQALDRYAERAYAGILEGRDVPNAVRGLIELASPFQRITQVTGRLENDATINGYFQAAEDVETYQAIIEGTYDGDLRVGGFGVAPPSLFTEVELGGTLYTAEDLALLTPEERTQVANAWFAERNPGYDPTAEMTYPETAQRAAEIARAADPADLAVQEAEDRFYNPGTPEQNAAAQQAKAIRDGTLPEGETITVTIDGQEQRFDQADLQRMTATERRALAAVWAAESGNQEHIDAYYAAREQVIADEPDLGGLFAMKNLAAAYPGGAGEWVREAIKENPTTYGQYAERLDPTRYPEGSEDWIKQMLSLEGYQALTQQRPSGSSPLAWETAPGAPVIPGLTGAATLTDAYAQQQAAEAEDGSKTPGQIVREDLGRIESMLTAADEWDATNGVPVGTSRGKIIDQMANGYNAGTNKLDGDLYDLLEAEYPAIGKDGEEYGPIPSGESFTRRYIVWALRQPEDQRDPELWSAQDWLSGEFEKAATQGLTTDPVTGETVLVEPEEPATSGSPDFLRGLGLVRGADGSGEFLSSQPTTGQPPAAPSYTVGGLGGTLYAEASTTSQPIIILHGQTPLTTVEESGDWVHVVEPGGLEGWMRKGYLSSTATTPATATEPQTLVDVFAPERPSSPTTTPTAAPFNANAGPLPVPPSQRTPQEQDALERQEPVSAPEVTAQVTPTATPQALIAPAGSQPGTKVTTAAMGQQIADLADDYAGVPYVHEFPDARDDPYQSGWDCSSFVHWIADNMGISEEQLPNGPGYVGGGVPVGSHFQYTWAVNNDRIIGDSWQDAQPGDIIFFNTDPNRARCDPANWNGCLDNDASHVGIFLGPDAAGRPQMIHAAAPGIGTVFEPLDTYPYPILGVARIW